MKKLMRVKLINWHRFVNTTIEMEDSTLISGENGAGKSTLLDAIQFVVTCSTNYFNKAAHENGKRKLTGYVRCKTGRENKPYERTGEISAHVALEFYEEKKQRYFIVGAVIDSASEGQEKWARYLMDGVRLSDDLFFNPGREAIASTKLELTGNRLGVSGGKATASKKPESAGKWIEISDQGTSDAKRSRSASIPMGRGSTPRSITQFRTANAKKIKTWCTTDKDARVMVRNRFGRIEEKFFRLIPKAMAFRPIDDIKDFVYSYVLDEKEVNIDILRENVRTYQDLQRTLENVKIRIGRLDVIERFHDQAADGQEKDRMYEYFLARAEADITDEKIAYLKRKAKNDGFRLEEQNTAIVSVTKEKHEKQEIRDSLNAELSQDKDFLARDAQKKKLQHLEEQREQLKWERDRLMQSVARAKKQAQALLEVKDVDACVRKYQEQLKQIDELRELAGFKQMLQEVIDYKTRMYGKVQMKRAELAIRMNTAQKEKQEMDKRIELLNRKKLSYPEEVNRVMEAICAEFLRIGRGTEPRVLCELLEITDDAWRNAVEGYLNTQRFYILVEPEHFDIALGTYDRLRKERKAYGVGLINTQKLDEYDAAPEGSLAAVVTSGNKYAKRFINMVLGKVHRCSHYSELKKYSTSITRECMKYQNHVASAIKPVIYETPFIGKDAFRVQLEQAKRQREELKSLLERLAEQEEQLDYVMKPLTTEMDTDIKYRVDVLGDIRAVETEMKKCKANIATLEKNTNMIQKQIQLEALEGLLRELDGKLVGLNRTVGAMEERIRKTQEDIAAQQADYALKKSVYLELGAKAGERLFSWNHDYEKQTSDKTREQFRDNFTRRKKANLTTVEGAVRNMEKAMVEYKTAHDFGAAPTMEGYPDFAAEYDKLKNSELLSYEEKVQSARNAAEEEFREQFLSKLQENMKNAQTEFKELNKALNDIVFSNEKYEFMYMPSKRYRQYYEMIMDDFNAMQGESIFSGLFHENHKEVIDELFEKLALDKENNVRALDEFTDYRTYMDYDIRIVHSDGSYSFYSKVCEEKSGGETQTPFYVTVAASFVQLYKNNIGGEAIGLVMFDEAFNNMDDERIGGVLEFLRRLPLQILIAAPPDKIQYISPYVSETLLVMTDERVSFVEQYHNGAIE